MFVKRFLVFLLVIIVGLSLGLTVYYFMQDDEVLGMKNTYVQANVGENITSYIKVEHINARATTTVDLVSNDTSVVSKDSNGNWIAVGGGTTTIALITSSNKFKNIECTVKVGDGTEANPFIVRNYEDLSAIGNTDVMSGRGLDKNYIQVADIDLSVTNPKQWTPIGYFDGVGFSGVYDGAGFGIHNLTITEPGAGETAGFPETPLTIQDAGLFGKIAATGIVKNIVMRDVNIDGSFNTAGALAGINYGTIELADVANGKVSSTYFNGKTGGLVGYNQAGSNIARISRTNAKLNVTGAGNVGGLVGENIGGLVINSYTHGSVTGTFGVAGGVIGLNEYLLMGGTTLVKANMINCYSVSTVTGGLMSGSLIGRNVNDGTDSKKINRVYGNYYDNGVNPFLAGIGGEADDAFTIVTKGATATQLRAAATYKTYTFTDITEESWNFAFVWDINSGVNNGFPTLKFNAFRMTDSVWDPADDYYTPVNTPEKFDNIRNFPDRNYKITSDIDLSIFAEWEPIGTEANPFTGKIVVERNPLSVYEYYLIRNMTITHDHIFTGLFGYLGPSAQISNLHLLGIDITNSVSVEENGAKNVGGIAGVSKGVLINCHALKDTNNADKARINIARSSDANVGGIAGVMLAGATVTECKSDLNITATANGGNWRVGGIAGQSSGAIEKGSFTGNISSGGSGSGFVYGGGIAGESIGVVLSCKATAGVILSDSRNTFAGGLVGVNGQYGLIQYSYAAKDTTGRTAGGLVGHNQGPNGHSSIDQCYAKEGTVRGNLVGGLVGRHERGNISNSYTLVTLNGATMGGLAGTIEGYTDVNGNGSWAAVSHCFAAVSFTHASGKAYFETSSKIRESLWFADNNCKTAGYVYNCIYDNTKGSGAERQYGNFRIGPWSLTTPDDGSNSTSGCQQFKTFTDRGFSTEFWSAVAGSYPVLNKVVV